MGFVSVDDFGLEFPLEAAVDLGAKESGPQIGPAQTAAPINDAVEEVT